MNPSRAGWMNSSRRVALSLIPSLIPALVVLLSSIFALAAAGPVHAAAECQLGDEDPDGELASIATRVSAFGGFYHDGSSLYVWLTDHGESLDAAVQEILSLPVHGLADLTPVALPAKYSFTQLFCWHWYQMSAVAWPDGIIFTDIDDAKNRLTVGVEDLSAQGPAVRAMLVEAGISLEAVDIIEEEPIMLLPGPVESEPKTSPTRWPVDGTRSPVSILAGIGIVILAGLSAAFVVRRRKGRSATDKALVPPAPPGY